MHHRFYTNAKWVNICMVHFLGHIFGSVFLFCLAPFSLSRPAHPWANKALIYSSEAYRTMHQCSQMHKEKYQGSWCRKNMTSSVLFAILGLLCFAN